MPVTNDFQPFATGSGANVVAPSTWAVSPTRFTGFQAGTASSALANTALRQASEITSTIAQFISDTLAQSVVDNGNIATLEAQFINAIQISVGSPSQASFWHFGDDTGPVNAMQVAAAPIITAYADGMMLATFPQFSNTTSNPTLSANGLAATVIVHNDGTALNPGDIAINTAVIFMYDADASHWRIISASVVPQAGLVHYGADVGTKNAMLVSTVTPGIAAVTTGMQFGIKKGAAANDAAVTLSIGGTSAALTWGDGTPLSGLGPEWPSGADGIVMYDGNYKLVGPPSPFAFIPPGTPPPLLAPRIYYVNVSTGSDTLNNGLSSGTAFASIQKAITATQSLNMNGFNVTINVADGTYGPIICGPLNGSGTVSLIGNTTTPANCLIHATTGEAVLITGAGYDLNGFALQSDAAGSAPHIGAGLRAFTSVSMQGISCGACASAHIWGEAGSNIVIHGVADGMSSAFINITGNAPIHLLSQGNITVGQTILNINGTRTIGVFWQALNGGKIVDPYSAINFISGATVTGQRYNAAGLSLINTTTGNTSYLPGSTAGVATSGSIYL